MNLFQRWSLSNRIGRLNQRISRLEKRRAQSVRELRIRQKQLTDFSDELRDLLATCEQSLVESKRLQEEYKTEIESARREIRVMEDTEKALVAANTTLLARWQAETAVLARQQGLNRPTVEE